MPDRLELDYDLTRDDWLAVNDAGMKESPEWAAAAATHRRTTRRQALWAAPVCVIGAAVLIGRGEGTQGMYVEEALLGACFAAFPYFSLPRLSTVESVKAAEARKIRQMDFAPFVGHFSITMDELGVHVRSPNREFRLSWQAVAPTSAGGFVVFQHGGRDGTIILPRAFASPEAAAEFLETARRWWQSAQLPHAERLARYLADRDDIACPQCGYNLRGIRGEACPECGRAIRLEELVDPTGERAARASAE